MNRAWRDCDPCITTRNDQEKQMETARIYAIVTLIAVVALAITTAIVV
ncbi:MAG: hypothetical protein H6945_11720 [Zoogloeaceae bacterium]|nr:hypothetical protein [Zoogloeaceae bacterium]